MARGLCLALASSVPKAGRVNAALVTQLPLPFSTTPSHANLRSFSGPPDGPGVRAGWGAGGPPDLSSCPHVSPAVMSGPKCQGEQPSRLRGGRHGDERGARSGPSSRGRGIRARPESAWGLPGRGPLPRAKVAQPRETRGSLGLGSRPWVPWRRVGAGHSLGATMTHRPRLDVRFGSKSNFKG